MKKIKKIFWVLCFLLYMFVWYSQSYADLWSNMGNSIKNQFEWKWLKTDMLVWEQDNNLISGQNNVNLGLWVDKNNVSFSKNFIQVVERYIFWLLWVVSVSVFIYIAYMLFTAEWKEDQFKKAIKALTYAIVWLAVIPLSFIVIKIVTWFNF